MIFLQKFSKSKSISKAKKTLKKSNKKMPPIGFEPRTARFEVQILDNYFLLTSSYFPAIIPLLLATLNTVPAASHCRLLAARSIF
jgi:hypothetical protein